MMSLRLAILALLAVGVSGANPIRRVVTLLQDMQKKIEAEGERDKELFDKFMCYCQTGAGDLEKSIKAAEAKIPAVTSDLQEAKAQKSQLEEDLKSHKQARSEAKDAVAEAKALRAKEAAAYAKESSDHDANIKALEKAIAAITKGMSGSFLQTGTAAAIRRLTIDMDLSSADRDIMSAFLSQKQEGSYAPQSGQINGILKQMKDTMEGDLASLTKNEKATIAAFEDLVAAKEKEIKANSKAIEAKTDRHGKVGVKIEELREDLEDTSASYDEDKKFLTDLDKNCATKKKEWEVVKKTRAEELLAIADTIKILNDDDSLDLFKKALPSPSLLQTTLKSQEVKQRALRALNVARHSSGSDTRLDLIALAIRGKKVSFDKVLKMIDDMVKLLGDEQNSDNDKKAYCEKELDKNEDIKKELDLDISDLTKTIEETEEAIATFGEEISALAAGIKALDKSVGDATKNRKEENEEYKSTMAADTAAKELLKIAKNRLNKFYNPKMYKAAPKRELSAEERISVNMGGTASPTPAPGGIAGTGVTVLAQVAVHTRRSSGSEAPPPPPETFGPYTKKGQESSGVLSMVDLLIADLDKEMQEMEVEEKDAQADYEKYIADSADKRTNDSKSIEEKESAKAAAEEALGKAKLEKKSKVKESYATAVLLRDLHLECDWLLSNFETRKQARAGEVDALKKAKAVLSGADFALLQMSRHFLAQRHA